MLKWKVKSNPKKLLFNKILFRIIHKDSSAMMGTIIFKTMQNQPSPKSTAKII